MSAEAFTLALDATVGISVGLARSTQPVDRSWEPARKQVELLQPMIDELMSRNGISYADLERIVVGAGPGSLMSVRIAMTCAQTLSLLAGVELIAVPSLDALALCVGEGDLPERFVVAIDAQRHEVYWSIYDSQRRRTEPIHVTSPEQLPNLPVAGQFTWLRYTERVFERIDGLDHVDGARFAAGFAAIDKRVDSVIYLREPDAIAATTRKSVLNKGTRLTLPSVYQVRPC